MDQRLPDPMLMEECGRAAKRLRAWAAEQQMTPEERAALRDEINQRFWPVYYSQAALERPAPKRRKKKADAKPDTGATPRAAQDDAAAADAVQAARQAQERALEAEIWTHLRSLACETGEQAALAAAVFQRIESRGGHQGHEWRALVEYCTKYADKIAEESQRARKARDAALKIADPKERAAELHRIGSTMRSKHYGIRGLLGELYLAHWPTWNRHVEQLMAEAQVAATRLGPGWRVEKVTTDFVRFGSPGRKSWDEAILLINDEAHAFAVHTTAQVKVSSADRVLEQTISDRAREIPRMKALRSRKGSTRPGGVFPTVLFLDRGGKTPEKFVIRSLPPDTVAHRYAFFPGGGELSSDGVEALERAVLRAEVLEMDMSHAAFDAAAEEVAVAIEKAAPRAKAAP
jgi:hypothetical protein